MDENNQNQNPGKDAKKVKDLYDKNIKTIVAIIGGNQNLQLKNKIPSNEVGDLVSELFKEDREEAVKQAKDDLRNILKKRVALQNEIDAKRKEFDALEVAKKKEFNTEFQKVVNKFENLGQLEGQYYAVLGNNNEVALEVATEQAEEEKEE